jgi:predicted GNAT family acetyltransferase
MAQAFDIQHVTEQNGGEFLIEQDGEKVGSMVYMLFGSGRLVINHTEVSKSLQGTGAAGQLVNVAVDYARAQGLKILPVCPFAKKYMTAKRETYADVLV